MRKITQILLNPRAKLPNSPTEEEYRISTRGQLQIRNVLTNFPLIFGGLIILVLFITVLFGPLFAPTNPYITGQVFRPYYDVEKEEWVSHPLSPSREHLLGTDQWGNDILSSLLYGARNTLVACAFITMVRLILGVVLGALAGWNEGLLYDKTIMGIISAISAIPLLISSMILVYALDIRRGLPVFIAALSVLGWTEIAQYIRSEFLVLRKMPFIEGAHAVGTKDFAIAVRHVLPNILPQILILSFFEMGAVLMLLGELSFLGVFIGGGSHIALGDEIMGTTVTLAEVPEWGTMLAEGYRWLRAKPFIVAAPAVAFFVSVIGLNSFGEGLRRLTETYHVNTNFLLRKRMILIIVLLSFATVFIINNTGPTPWFDKVSSAFDGQSAYSHIEVLAEMEGRGVSQLGQEQAVDYIADKFQSYGLLPGWKHSSYIYNLPSQIVLLRSQPVLEIVDNNENVTKAYRHQLDFGFMIEGHGGSGDVTHPITFIGFNTAIGSLTWESYQGLDLQDQILLLIEGNAPADFPTEALIRGARGVLWVTDENPRSIQSQIQLADQNKYYLSNPTIPIFKISPSTAQAILNHANLKLGDLFIEGVTWDQTGNGWYTLPINISIHMSISLSDPSTAEIPCAIGYLQGSDIEIANELVVVAVNYDGLGKEPAGIVFPASNHNASGVSILLEIAHLWQEQNLDTRRSVLFIAWGGGTLENPGLTTFLSDPVSYRHLPAQSGRRRLSPAVIIQFSGVGAGDDVLLIHLDSSTRLSAYIEEKASEIGIPINYEDNTSPLDMFNTRQTGADWIYFTWEGSNSSLDEDTIDKVQVEKLDSTGEILSHLLIQLVRQSHY